MLDPSESVNKSSRGILSNWVRISLSVRISSCLYEILFLSIVDDHMTDSSGGCDCDRKFRRL